jgi:hypothetical protein
VSPASRLRRSTSHVSWHSIVSSTFVDAWMILELVGLGQSEGDSRVMQRCRGISPVSVVRDQLGSPVLPSLPLAHDR